MFIPIPGFVIATASFPGVIVHEMAHQLVCRLFGIAVLDVCYFRIGDPSGYVVHEIPRTPAQSIWIGVGPFFLNTIVGALIAAPSAITAFRFNSASPIDFFMIWFGISIAMHAFPSIGDARTIWEAVKGPAVPWALKLVAVPIVGIIYVGAVGSAIWLDVAYGIGVAMLIPGFIVGWLV